MMTGEPNIESAAAAVRLGAYDYLSKPIHLETMLQTTHKALRHKALLDEKAQIAMEKERYRGNLEAIFRSVQDALITVDNAMNVLEANQATQGICGWHPQELIGQKFSDAPGQCDKSCYEVIEHTLQDRSTISGYRVECRHQKRPGQVVLITSSPLQCQDDRSIGAVLIIRDITRIIDMERELSERYQFHQIIGKSSQMQEIFNLLEDLADTDTTVLIKGESGTGKELIANALHYSGIRAAKPLIKVNCAALSENLLESELFGHVKGAFTGAVKNKVGRFQAAHEGTIFLDEIGDVSPLVQLKLLRVLQEKVLEQVGDSTSHKVDVRVIAATNSDLADKVTRGEFRPDFYYRLKVVEINLPPLRERLADIPLLVKHFLQQFNRTFKKDIDGLSTEVEKLFMNYPWPGNIRELQHALEHAFVLCKGGTITSDHLSQDLKDYYSTRVAQSAPRAGSECQKIIDALTQTGWNKVRAARLLGISRRTIYRKITEHNIISPPEKV
jgi:PAS domain S-box-containing protein